LQNLKSQISSLYLQAVQQPCDSFRRNIYAGVLLVGKRPNPTTRPTPILARW
jgi:hypothetical protein